MKNMAGEHPWQSQKSHGGNGGVQNEDRRQSGAEGFLARLVTQQPLGGKGAEASSEKRQA